SELEQALDEFSDDSFDTPAVALLALAARRDASAGRHASALARYERLRGTRFEPETTIALERAVPLAANSSAVSTSHARDVVRSGLTRLLDSRWSGAYGQAQAASNSWRRRLRRS